MEEEPRVFTNFVEFFRHVHAQVDHWSTGENSFSHVSLLEDNMQPVEGFEEVVCWEKWRSTA
ncbi:MAG: hypothetical protein N2Z84_00225, partial [Atribacterota bacterium]|nr:hypothetical protein [Atribacterota bacterium]